MSNIHVHIYKHSHTITLQHLTINLSISVICLGVITLVLIRPVRPNTPDLFQLTLLVNSVLFSLTCLTSHTQMNATILGLWQLHFIKVTSRQTHTTRFPSPPLPAPSHSCPYLLPPSINTCSVLSSPYMTCCKWSLRPYLLHCRYSLQMLLNDSLTYCSDSQQDLVYTECTNIFTRPQKIYL